MIAKVVQKARICATKMVHIFLWKDKKESLTLKNIKLSLRFLCRYFHLNHTIMDKIVHIAYFLNENSDSLEQIACSYESLLV